MPSAGAGGAERCLPVSVKEGGGGAGLALRFCYVCRCSLDAVFNDVQVSSG